MIAIETERLVLCLGLVVGEYVMVLGAVIADLVSGVRKAKKRGEARKSKAFRRTVDKLARYYNLLFGLSVVDLMQIAGIEYLRMTMDYYLPLFPIFTLFGAIGMALIELKSIYEKSEAKEREEYAEAMRLIMKYGERLKNLKDEISE